MVRSFEVAINYPMVMKAMAKRVQPKTYGLRVITLW